MGRFEWTVITYLIRLGFGPYNPSINADYGPSPGSCSPMSSKVSVTDPEDNSPATPDFNHSCSAYDPVPGASPAAVSYHTKHHNNNNSDHSHHPYRPLPCFQDIHTFDSQLGRPQADHDTRLGAPDTNTDDVFLRCMDGLSPASCRYLVHYKEAVRERQRMRLFTTYWELEETNRLQTLLASLYAEADAEFRTADREAQNLLKALVTKESVSRPAAELEFLGEIRQRDKMSLRETDSRLDLLGDYVKQRQESRNLDDTSNRAGGNPIVTDN